MHQNHYKFLLFFLSVFALGACSQLRRSGTTRPDNRPRNTERTDRLRDMDTVRWVEAPAFPPAIGEPKSNSFPLENPDPPGTEYRIAMVLPFMGDQSGPITSKNEPALQYYGGARMALNKISETTNLNLQVQVFDSQADEFKFKRLLRTGKLDDAQVLIGPVRPVNISSAAPRAKQNRQILVSPLSPSSNQTEEFPGFIQFSPSLGAHCGAITRHVRAKYSSDQVVLVCRKSEVSRLAYFQKVNAELGDNPFVELLIPDQVSGINSVNFSRYMKPGKTTVFIMPSWAGQDFIVQFLYRLKATKGSKNVEVYGMPQWAGYEGIEPEYLSELNVHISSANYVDRTIPEVIDFEEAFFKEYGTIPSDDAVTGYETTMFTANMLQRFGLSFPEQLEFADYLGLRGYYTFKKVYNSTGVDRIGAPYDYVENVRVSILKFDKYRFVRAE